MTIFKREKAPCYSGCITCVYFRINLYFKVLSLKEIPHAFLFQKGDITNF